MAYYSQLKIHEFEDKDFTLTQNDDTKECTVGVFYRSGAKVFGKSTCITDYVLLFTGDLKKTTRYYNWVVKNSN